MPAGPILLAVNPFRMNLLRKIEKARADQRRGPFYFSRSVQARQKPCLYLGSDQVCSAAFLPFDFLKNRWNSGMSISKIAIAIAVPAIGRVKKLEGSPCSPTSV